MGWSGRAMVLGNFQCRGFLLGGAKAYRVAKRSGWGLFGYFLSPIILPSWRRHRVDSNIVSKDRLNLNKCLVKAYKYLCIGPITTTWKIDNLVYYIFSLHNYGNIIVGY